MLYGLDRFEGEFAVLIDGQGTSLNVQRDLLPNAAVEGDLLSFEDGVYTINSEATSEKRKEVRSLIDELFK